MLNGKFLVIALYLTGALASSAVSAASHSAPEVVLIFGTGFSPHNLKQGTQLQKGTLIKADSNTIVVLNRTWSLKEGGMCEDWVILRGRKYRVETSTHENCPERGRGDEVARAMNGESMVAHLTVLGFDDPKADSFMPEKLRRLQIDLYKLKEKAEKEVSSQSVYQPLVGTMTRYDGGALQEKAQRSPIPQAPGRAAMPRKPGALVKSSFASEQRGPTWFVDGTVRNISGRHLVCVRLRFKMSTSPQDIQRGARDLIFGTLEVEVRNLAVGEERRYNQALAAQVALVSAPTEECE